jgi:hypothetical protein
MRAGAGRLFGLYAERYARHPVPASGFYPPQDLGRNMPLPLNEGWVETDRAKKVTGMARTFRIVTAASPSLLLERAKRTASENGVRLFGDERSGRFSHKMLEGEYRRIRRTVIVTITHKHQLVPWSVLERRLRGLFGSGPSGMPRVRERSKAGTGPRPRGRRRARRRPPHHRRHPHRR